MYRRFRDSIVYPKFIIDYRNDKLIWVLLYIIFFALLLSTRMIIDTTTFDGLNTASKEQIMQNFATLDGTCSITDTAYVCDNPDSTLVYKDTLINFYLESNDSLQTDNYDGQYNVVIFGDSVYFMVGGTTMFSELLTSLPGDLTNLDFSLQQSNPDQFYGQIFQATDDFIMHYKSMWVPMLIVIDFVSSLILFMIFILFSAWMLRVRFREIPFKQLFTMTAYSSTALYVVLIFNSLFNLSFFIIIVLLIVAFRQNNQLSMEIMRRLQKKP